MSDIKYKVEFYSWWHCGSGQASGAGLDELVIKDRNGLPFIPGRTIKGLLRDACDELNQYDGLSEDEINSVFGFFDDDKDSATKGEAFFSNVELPEEEQTAIAAGEGLKECLYSSISSTAINDKGIAKDHSLRKIQVTVPCTLEGHILNVPESFEPSIKKAMKLVKRLGMGRNHGLGRCKVYPIE